MLQRRVFPALDGVELVSRATSRGPGGYRSIAESLYKAADDEYDPTPLRTLLGPQARTPGRTLLLSDEILTGRSAVGRERTASRLAAACGEARVLIVVRNQRTLLPSLYAQHVRGRGGTATLSGFLSGETVAHLVEYASFDVVVAAYQEVFGPANLVVLPYEMLVTDARRFVARIAEHVTGTAPPSLDDAVVENRSLSPTALQVVRLGNRVLRKSRFNPRPLVDSPGTARHLSEAVERIDRVLARVGRRRATDQAALAGVLSRFATSNARLQEITGLDLAGLGYPLPD